jgi:LemA protein
MIIVLAAAVLVLVVVAVMYNGFISRRNAVRNAFAGIDVQLKKRWDLVPPLVETVKGYARHERELFERVVEARKRAQGLGSGSAQRFAEEDVLGAGVGRLIALAEDYPELKASGQFFNLQRNLTEIESQLAAARRAYNAAVTEWNESVEMFPGSVFASVFNFRREEWFETPGEERRSQDVRF